MSEKHLEETCRLLICCGVLRGEVELLLREGRIEATPHFIDADLCCDYPALARAMEHALGSSHQSIVLYGLCHPTMDAIVARHEARRVQATNCVSMLIGEKEFADAVAKGSFFLLPGWVPRWRQALNVRLGPDEEIVRGLLAEELNGAIYLDTGVMECPKDPLDEFTAYSGLTVEQKSTSLDHLTTILAEVTGGVCSPD